jgi:protein-ribulosamine 3-kinase
MNPTLRQHITAALQAIYGNDLHIAAIAPAAGSSFSSTARLTLQNGELLFVKYASRPLPGSFAREYEALRLLCDTRTLQVPEPICSSNEFIVTRWIEFGSKTQDWHETFGRGLALLHQAQQSSRYGFDHDNYLGASPQANGWQTRWLDFWRDCRLGAQLVMWRTRHGNGDELLRLGECLLARLDQYLAGINESGAAAWRPMVR